MQIIKWVCGCAVGLMAAFSAPSAFAYDWVITAHVTMVEPTYVPASLDFFVDTAAGSCAAGTPLTWTIQGADEASKIANVQAVLSTLMTAEVAQQTVKIYGYNSGCTVAFIWLL